MHLNAHINPSPAYAMAMGEAIQNNNEGLALKRSGNYEAAEQKYLKALDLKLKHIGENTITTAEPQRPRRALHRHEQAGRRREASRTRR